MVVLISLFVSGRVEAGVYTPACDAASLPCCFAIVLGCKWRLQLGCAFMHAVCAPLVQHCQHAMQIMRASTCYLHLQRLLAHLF